VEVRRI
jgi:hypothetical protein